MDQLLFSVIGNAICGHALTSEEKTQLHNLEAVQNLFKIANLHDLAHLLAGPIIQENADIKIRAELQKKQIIAIFHRQRMDEVQQLIRNAFADKVDFIFLKGSVLCSLYPETWMRTSCDIDVLIKSDDFSVACAQLENAGLIKGKSGAHDVKFYSKDKIVSIELHYSLADNTVKVLNEPWDNAKNIGSSEYKMSDEYFYMYHIYHMKKHILEGGCGVRPFLDLWLLDKRKYNDEKLKELLCEAGIYEFSQNASKLAKFWFSKEPADENIQKLANFILSGGVYGNSLNRTAVGVGNKGVKFIFSWAFPSYNTLVGDNPNGKKFLLPYYWLRRIFVATFNKKRRSAATRLVKSYVNTNKDSASQVDLLFADLGIK